MWVVVAAMLQAGTVLDEASAQTAASDVQMQYDRRSLRIRARNADLKRVLTTLAETVDITIDYPETLERRVTLNRRSVTIEDALDAMLIGINHVIFYSGRGPDETEITRVTIIGKAPHRQPTSPRQRQLTARIAAYNRQIAVWQRRLSAMDADSARGRRYADRIRRLEQRIERLEQPY